MSELNRYALATALASLAFVASGGVLAAEQAVKAEEAAAAKTSDASIAFVNHGGVRDWQTSGDDKVYIQDSGGKWYLATLVISAPDLPYANAIGFETKGIDRLDKFGAIVIAGTRYQLASLVTSGPPPPKQKK